MRWMRLIDRWWCEEPPVRHVHLRRGEAPSEPAWRLVTTEADAQPRQQDFDSEADARGAARAFMDERPGRWHGQPASRSAVPPAGPGSR